MKKLFTLFLLSLLPLAASAQPDSGVGVDDTVDTVEVNGICYSLNDETKTAIVMPKIEWGAGYEGDDAGTRGSRTETWIESSYKGDVMIPETFIYAENSYTVISIGKAAFNYCTELNSVTIPQSVITISERAFFYCSSLKSVSIPNGVIFIGDHAFEGCTNLSSVNIPTEITSIGIGVFSSCESLKNVTLPSKVTSIGGSAFSHCISLESIEFPDGVTNIERDAFYGCSGLEYVVIPNSLTSIGYMAFEGCSGLTSVRVSDIAAWCNISFGSESANPLYEARHLILNGEEINEIIIPDIVTSISDYAFYNCSSLTSLTIPRSVKSSGRESFFGCDNLCKLHVESSDFRDLSFSESIKTLTINYRSIFDTWYLPNLEELIIGERVKYISYASFTECPKIQTIKSFSINISGVR